MIWAEITEILRRNKKFQTGTYPIFLREGVMVYVNYTNTVN